MMNQSIQDLLTFFGRIFFALIFITAGFDKIINFSDTAMAMASKGVPAAEWWLLIALIMELGGSLLILFGLWTRFGALLIILFIIPVTYVFHTFWTYEAAEAVNQFHHFMKNLTILGGALYIISYGAGRWSIDYFWRST